MKRKIFIAMLTLISVISLAACASTDKSATSAAPSITAPSTPAPGSIAAKSEAYSESKILIVYYSRMGNMNFDEGIDAVASASVNSKDEEFVGNNKIIADLLAEKTGGDVFFIQQKDKYPAQYRATTDQAKEEQGSSHRPALEAEVENFSQYSTIILVYPIWWGTLPPAVNTFLEEYDFSGKTVLPLATHGGSGLGSSEGDIEKLCPGATLAKGLAIHGSDAADAKNAVDDWIDSAGILNN